MLDVLLAAVLAQMTPSPVPSALPLPAATPATTQLLAAPSAVAVHPGATAVVKITGAVGAITATSGPLVTLSVDQTTQSITIAAAGQLGHDAVTVRDASGASINVAVLVAQDAGTVPQSLTMNVTGSPIDPAWLQHQLVQTVTQNISTMQAPPAIQAPPLAPPAPGATATVPVAVTIPGNGTYIDVNATTNVTVKNVAVEPFAPPTLMYDDDPEHISADGVAYRGTVSATAPSRLYFYHDNAGDPRQLAVILSTASNAPASVQVIDATAGPNIDVMSVGHAVSRDFLLMKPRNQGVIYDVAPSAPLVLHNLVMRPRDGVAGTLGLNVLSGGPVTVTVVAASPGVNPTSMLSAPMLARDGHHRTGVFDLNNFGTQSLAFAVGGPDASLVFADRQPSPANVDATADGHDYGDYGVIHTLLFSLSNPTSEAATVYLYERPIGGIVRSSFVVDGNLVEMGCVRKNTTRYQIAAFSLAPSARYQLNVGTMTDGGSNYPIEVGLTATVPQPTTPPLSAPEGCFPK